MIMIFFSILINKEENTNKTEAMDWMTKYFILISMFDLLFFLNDFIMAQKVNVLISKAIQIKSHEFKVKHIREERIRIPLIKGIVLILYVSNCKFDYNENILKTANAFYVLKTNSLFNLSF
jgi:hypothetical protein